MEATEKREVASFKDLTPTQWRSGIAAWLGWLFDGLDMHLYTLVAAPFVAELLHASSTTDPRVGRYGSIIQAAFLVGWALGGAFFGRIGDRMGRARALSLTVLMYASFTGLSFFAQTWWHLLLCRFLSALGIGGEWAVGASLLSETWPKRWREWIAAVLQSGVNIGIVFATVAVYLLARFPERTVFLVGILPALLVFWIRRYVPEPEEWHTAKAAAGAEVPRIRDLFRGRIRAITFKTVAVCALTLTAHWAFQFWYQVQLRNLPEVLALSPQKKNELASMVMFVVMIASIVGNFAAAALARSFGYRRAMAVLCLTYLVAMLGAYGTARPYTELLVFLPVIGMASGMFALFTMYMPPLFPTLLRTTGAGFCYNIGRIVAAAGTVFFGLFSNVGDYRTALLYSSFLFLPAAVLSFFLPELRTGPNAPAPAD
jgi:MFS family permease